MTDARFQPEFQPDETEGIETESWANWLRWTSNATYEEWLRSEFNQK